MMAGDSSAEVEALGGVDGVAEALGVDARMGLSNSSSFDLRKRKERYLIPLVSRTLSSIESSHSLPSPFTGWIPHPCLSLSPHSLRSPPFLVEPCGLRRSHISPVPLSLPGSCISPLTSRFSFSPCSSDPSSHLLPSPLFSLRSSPFVPCSLLLSLYSLFSSPLLLPSALSRIRKPTMASKGSE